MTYASPSTSPREWSWCRLRALRRCVRSCRAVGTPAGVSAIVAGGAVTGRSRCARRPPRRSAPGRARPAARPCPAARSRSSRSASHCRPRTSSRCSGSSRISTRRGRTKHEASASRRRCPLDSVTGSWSRAGSRPSSARTSSTGSASPPWAYATSSRCSTTDRSGKKSMSSRAAATSARTCGSVSSARRPCTSTSPASGRSAPTTQRSRVVLPLPLGPSTTAIRPAASVKLTSSSTTRLPKLRLSPRTESASTITESPRAVPPTNLSDLRHAVRGVGLESGVGRGQPLVVGDLLGDRRRVRPVPPRVGLVAQRGGRRHPGRAGCAPAPQWAVPPRAAAGSRPAARTPCAPAPECCSAASPRR